jgi:UDP-N-acetylglucosamine 2-epimerase (non-hydrolysing)
MAPVIRELKNYPSRIVTKVCVTAQHRTMLDQTLAVFEVVPDHDLQVMRPNQRLSDLTAKVLVEMEKVLELERPDWVLVQGDTTTSMAAGLAAFYRRTKVGHIEAGLRTRDKYQPFPEEIDRRILDLIADLCFAPTEAARRSLLSEGIRDSAIRVTGNTVIDALLWVRDRNRRRQPVLPLNLDEVLGNNRVVLITGHRRESFGKPFETICLAVRELAQLFKNIHFVYPVHLNPNVQDPVRRLLGGLSNVHLIDPLPYDEFVCMMERASVILTDSGGVQEEAPSLGKPVLVMREATERPEGIDAGNARLVRTNRQQIVEETKRLLEDETHYHASSVARNPYGDGHAARRIVEALLE